MLVTTPACMKDSRRPTPACSNKAETNIEIRKLRMLPCENHALQREYAARIQALEFMWSGPWYMLASRC